MTRYKDFGIWWQWPAFYNISDKEKHNFGKLYGQYQAGTPQRGGAGGQAPLLPFLKGGQGGAKVPFQCNVIIDFDNVEYDISLLLFHSKCVHVET